MIMTRSASPSGAILQNSVAQRARIGGADFFIDVEAVGLDADRDNLRAQFIERRRRHLIARAIRRIDHDAQTGETKPPREGRLHDLDIARLRVVDAARTAETRRRGETRIERLIHQLLDLHFVCVREFVAVGTEELDSVVGVFVVAGGDHHAEIGPEAPRQHRHRRRRQRAEEDDIHPRRGEASR
jgi:hypothetical protein